VNLVSSTEQQDILNGYRLGCSGYLRTRVDFSRFHAARSGSASTGALE